MTGLHPVERKYFGSLTERRAPSSQMQERRRAFFVHALDKRTNVRNLELQTEGTVNV